MPTILSHAAVPIAIGLGLGRSKIPVGLIAAGIALAMLPDLDVIGLGAGVPYEHPLGHRGASHALLPAAVIAVAGSLAARMLALPIMRVFIFLFIASASHGLLDAFTNGGHGVALLWPFSHERIFAPFRPIEASPLGVGFFSPGGLEVLISEALWVWLPLLVLAVAIRLAPREPDWVRRR